MVTYEWLLDDNHKVDYNMISLSRPAMECGYIVGSAVYTDAVLEKDITVVGW